MPVDFGKLTGFEWDTGNSVHASAHGVLQVEAESVFFLAPLVYDDTRPGQNEPRFAVLGKSSNDRVLRIIFTVRGTKIRPISVRCASRKEREQYGQTIP
ncbi:MAG TPA: BrnT family toxin [Opitutaceae bacterium]|nr:BrnT family toxin [Opitutaceae bacterium]